jgi:outer membrane lipoprotein SlyB
VALALPGVGAVVAAGAIVAGLLGAIAGGAVGSQLDDTLSKGPPADELYVYRHALQLGRTVVIAMAEDDAEAEHIRAVAAKLGAESVDVARQDMWTGPPGCPGGTVRASSRRPAG